MLRQNLICKEVNMFADLGRMMPQEFNNKERCLQWCQNKQLGLKHSIKLLLKESDHLIIRTPLTNEIVHIYGTPEEISWLHLELIKSESYSYR